VNFFDKHSDETRSLNVDACDWDEAENIAADRADAMGWPQSFKVADAEEIISSNAESEVSQ